MQERLELRLVFSGNGEQKPTVSTSANEWLSQPISAR
jgi:hypothetical protein